MLGAVLLCLSWCLQTAVKAHWRWPLSWLSLTCNSPAAYQAMLALMHGSLASAVMHCCADLSR